MPPTAGQPVETLSERTARFVLGPFDTNCYVLRARETASHACWIIDAGFAPDPLIGYIDEQGLVPELILLTHAHADHIAGLDALRERYPGVPVALHAEEARWLDDPELNLSQAFGMPMRFDPAEKIIADQETLNLAGERWTVMHTPGHSPGSVSLLNRDANLCFAGDTLFYNSIGRFDFPTSDGELLFASIRESLYSLPEEIIVLPGHGPTTTVGHERNTNPFVRPE